MLTYRRCRDGDRKSSARRVVVDVLTVLVTAAKILHLLCVVGIVGVVVRTFLPRNRCMVRVINRRRMMGLTAASTTSHSCPPAYRNV